MGLTRESGCSVVHTYVYFQGISALSNLNVRNLSHCINNSPLPPAVPELLARTKLHGVRLQDDVKVFIDIVA